MVPEFTIAAPAAKLTPAPITTPVAPVMVPELLILPTKVATLATDMPAPAAETVPVLTTPPPALVLPNCATLLIAMPGPPAAVTVPELVMPPKKVETSLTLMPILPAEIVPPLLMPPEKVEKVTFAPAFAVRPTRMPILPAEIVPELAMPPEKVEMVVMIAAP